MACNTGGSKSADKSETVSDARQENPEVCMYVGEKSRDEIFRIFAEKITASSGGTDHEILYFPFTGRIEYNEIKSNRTINVDFEKDILLADDPKTDEYFTRALRVNLRNSQCMDTIGDMLYRMDSNLAADKVKCQNHIKTHCKPAWLERVDSW